MMDRVILLALAVACTCLAGCQQEDISLEGKILHITAWGTYPHTPPDEAAAKMQQAGHNLKQLPALLPTIERLEWRRFKQPKPLRFDHERPEGYELYVVFDDVREARDPERQRVFKEAAGEYIFGAGGGIEYLMHDATPQVRTTNHGRLQRNMSFYMYQDTPPEQITELEKVLNALPTKIPEVTKLVWGAECRRTSRPRRKSPYPAPTRKIDRYVLMATFENEEARDAFLANPACRELEGLVKANNDKGLGYTEYVPHVEYIRKAN